MKRLSLKANCRVDNYCVFCNSWLGKKPYVNHINGESEIFSEKGLCSKYNEFHEPTELCNFFARQLIYR